MRDDLTQILQQASELRRLLALTPDQRAALEQQRAEQGDLTSINEEIGVSLGAILEQTGDLITFLDRFESSPIIYTGEGSTEEVLEMLERAVAVAQRP